MNAPATESEVRQLRDNDPISETRLTGRVACNRNAKAGFAEVTD